MVGTNFELYRLLVEEVREARRARRELSNWFLTLNVGGVGALGFLARGEAARLDSPALLFWAAIALIFTCWIWRISNRYYTHMLAAKYRILYEVEERLAGETGCTPIRSEWDLLRPNKPNRTFFSLEYAMPVLFIIGYVVFLCFQTSPSEVQAMAEAIWRPIAELIARFTNR